MNLEQIARLVQALFAEIEAVVAETHGLRPEYGFARSDFLASQQRANACNEFTRQERFGEVVVGTGFQTDDLIDGIAFGGEDENGQRLALGAQAPADR